ELKNVIEEEVLGPLKGKFIYTTSKDLPPARNKYSFVRNGRRAIYPRAIFGR
ncbi:hypothetical protein ACJX0J_037421, partial [Zea mays]